MDLVAKALGDHGDDLDGTSLSGNHEGRHAVLVLAHEVVLADHHRVVKGVRFVRLGKHVELELGLLLRRGFRLSRYKGS